MKKKDPACGNSDCSVSTGIHDGLTFGRGELDSNGFWEFPCSPCARQYEVSHPNDGECWPFKGQNIEQLTKDFHIAQNEEWF
jgi:hypothetical protein